MKTAISIPDKVFQAAERAAGKLGMSRSELYTNAVKDYLSRHRSLGVREKLDAIYAQEDSQLDASVEASQVETLRQSDW